MQTIIKKWKELSKEEVQNIFSLRAEVFIVEQQCLIKMLMEETMKQITFYYMKTTFFVGILEFFQKHIF